MLIVQISDPHVVPSGWLAHGQLDTGRLLERSVATIETLEPQPDAVLITGDLVALPDEGAYAEVVRHLRRIDPIPVYPLPGNHDDRTMMRSAFQGHRRLPAEGRLHYAVDLGPLRLICLDSLVTEGSWGLLGDDQIAWLDACLGAAPERPTLVALHHPPVRTGIGHMDWSMLRDAAELEPVIGRHPQVERVLCGHVHRHVVQRFGGTIAEIAPGSAHQVKLVLGPERGPWIAEPPAMLLHVWNEAGGLVTHTHFIGDFAPEGRFEDPHFSRT